METADFCPTYTLQSTWCRELDLVPEGTLPPLPEALAAIESTSHHAKCIPTVNADRPVCLDVVCDKVDNVIKFRAGTEVLTCFFDGQELEIPGTDGIKVKCPRVASVCPENQCPANCSGQGLCERKEGERPKCLCNDADDETEGCYVSFRVVPPKFIRQGSEAVPEGALAHSSSPQRSWTPSISILAAVVVFTSLVLV